MGRWSQTKDLKGKYDKAPIQEPVRPYGVSERWYVGVWGPYKEDSSPFFEVVAIDAFSKYEVAETNKGKSANTWQNCIMNEICLIFGVPKHISFYLWVVFLSRHKTFPQLHKRHLM